MDIFNKKKVVRLEKEIKDLEETLEEIRGYEEENSALNEIIEERTMLKNKTEADLIMLNKKLDDIKNEMAQIEPSYISINENIERYRDLDIFNDNIEQIIFNRGDKETISKFSLNTKLDSMDNEEIKSALEENREQINNLVESYEKRYTSKANLTTFRFMVIALKAELQNVVYNLQNRGLEDSKHDVKFITEKFLIVAEGGNKQLLGSIIKFISEIEGLFIREIEISNRILDK